MIVFNTKRLDVRELSRKNLSDFHDLQSNPRVMKYTGQDPLTFGENKIDLDKVISHYDKVPNNFRIWGVFVIGTDELIGTCAIVTSKQAENEIGYRIREKFWGNGYGLEITQELINHGLQTMNLASLYADVDTLNVHSVNILEKCMNFESQEWNEKDKSNDRKYRIKNEKISS